jgi:hypothetical protein
MKRHELQVRVMVVETRLLLTKTEQTCYYGKQNIVHKKCFFSARRNKPH